MSAKPATWFPIAFVLSVVNLIWVAMTVAQPAHAAAHLVAAAGFGIWAMRLRHAMAGSETRLESAEAVDALYGELNELRRELSELQERLDFTERLLAHQSDVRSTEPQHRSSP